MRDMKARGGADRLGWRRGLQILSLVFAFGALAMACPQDEDPLAELQQEEAARPATAEDAAATAVDEAVDAVEEAAPAVAPEKAPFEFSGTLSLSYRARLRDDDNDEDLYGYLRLDGGRKRDRDLSFHLSARATYDLDGDARSNDPFYSLNDTGGDRLDAKLYEAWVDLEGDLAPTSLGIRRIRLGRQRVNAGLSFLVDGGRIDFQRVEDLGNLEVSIFGGVPEYLYESSRSGNWLVGIDVNIHPDDSTRLDVRYVHIEDENDYIGGDQTDDYLSVAFMQEFFENFRIYTTWNTVSLDTRDVRARANLEIPDWDLSLSASYFYQGKVTEEYTTLLDSYVGILGVSYAYHQIDFEVSKIFGENFGLDLGATIRQLEDDDEEAAFNREFYRIWATLSAQRWPADEIGLALTFEWWDGDDDSVFSTGGEVDWRPTDDLRFSFGSYYSLYKYDLFVVDERSDVTTIFLKVRWNVTQDFRLDGRYEFETGDEGDYHTFFIGFDWRF